MERAQPDIRGDCQCNGVAMVKTCFGDRNMTRWEVASPADAPVPSATASTTKPSTPALNTDPTPNPADSPLSTVRAQLLAKHVQAEKCRQLRQGKASSICEAELRALNLLEMRLALGVTK